MTVIGIGATLVLIRNVRAEAGAAVTEAVAEPGL